ncbi:hypothetical protein OS493_006175 [Desmophyllum pertusum]|uniref:Uncharacterized protein n=1 Tax=Desmophyllum pertusum TaxID=174260 RepID=A0A9X0DAB9_9CNID|nr:hypothetical protein OS493_006175 [Desmophyllum pertusum]
MRKENTVSADSLLTTFFSSQLMGTGAHGATGARVQPRAVTVQFTGRARATAPCLLMAGNRARARDTR